MQIKLERLYIVLIMILTYESHFISIWTIQLIVIISVWNAASTEIFRGPYKILRWAKITLISRGTATDSTPKRIVEVPLWRSLLVGICIDEDLIAHTIVVRDESDSARFILIIHVLHTILNLIEVLFLFTKIVRWNCWNFIMGVYTLALRDLRLVIAQLLGEIVQFIGFVIKKLLFVHVRALLGDSINFWFSWRHISFSFLDNTIECNALNRYKSLPCFIRRNLLHNRILVNLRAALFDKQLMALTIGKLIVFLTLKLHFNAVIVAYDSAINHRTGDICVLKQSHRQWILFQLCLLLHNSMPFCDGIWLFLVLDNTDRKRVMSTLSTRLLCERCDLTLG